jgi:D-amino-acid dehydrogenase
MLPVMGPAPRHRGLWFNFGHGHQGFTLGPVAGRLLAELISGEPPFLDPAPYAAQRLGP